MNGLTSSDGTTIAFDLLGDGPPVILVCGGSTLHKHPTSRRATSRLPQELASSRLSGYRGLLAASIHGRTTSRFSEAHRIAPANGSSSSLIVDSRSLICASVSSSASMNA